MTFASHFAQVSFVPLCVVVGGTVSKGFLLGSQDVFQVLCKTCGDLDIEVVKWKMIFSVRVSQ